MCLLVACGDGDRCASSDCIVEIPLDPSSPFTVSDGIIDRQSNAHGMHGSYFAIHNERVATLEVTELTGEICINGDIAPRDDADPETFWAFSVGFLLDPALAPTTTRPIDIDPQGQSPWDLGGGQVVGVSVALEGARIPSLLGFIATPGGENPDEAVSQYADCSVNAPASGSGRRVFSSRFDDLHYYCWNAAQFESTVWSAPSAISFGWAVGADEASNPFDFCLSEITPILAD